MNTYVFLVKVSEVFLHFEIVLFSSYFFMKNEQMIKERIHKTENYLAIKYVHIVQGPPFALGQTNKLFSGLRYRAEVKIS